MIEQTIERAVERFSVPITHILRGGFWKYAGVVKAREWIASQHPDVSHSELARELGYADHSAVVRMRQRMTWEQERT